MVFEIQGMGLKPLPTLHCKVSKAETLCQRAL